VASNGRVDLFPHHAFLDVRVASDAWSIPWIGRTFRKRNPSFPPDVVPAAAIGQRSRPGHFLDFRHRERIHLKGAFSANQRLRRKLLL
jgi:hypothetical protein